jgi:DNA polymerase
MKPRECYGCPLFDRGNSFADLEGSARIAIVGEALGHEEAIDRLPFRPHAPAGSVLTKAIRDIGRSRSDFRILNVIQCQPPRNELRGADYEQAAIRHCEIHRDRRLEGVDLIIAVGDTAYRTLVLTDQPLDKMRGFILRSNTYKGIPVIATYHPAYLRRGNMHLMPLLMHDLGLAFRGSQHIDKPEFIEDPTIEDLKALILELRRNPRLRIACDIETEVSPFLDEELVTERKLENRIESIQFAVGSRAYFVPWSDQFVPYIKAILELPNPKVGHNWWFFDAVVLRHNDIKVNGYVHDTMVMYKFTHPDLPRSLQAVAAWYDFPFPWKHKIGTPEYGCWDAFVTNWIYERIVAEMQSLGIAGNDRELKGYLGQICRMHPIIQRISERGLPVDASRMEALRENVSREYERALSEMQRHVPPELLGLSPKRKDGSVGYVRTPKQVKELQAKGLPDDEIERSLGMRKLDDGKWAKVKPFVPSSKQVLSYIRYMTTRNKKYSVPTDHKGHKETSAKRDLEILAERTQDPLLQLVLVARSYQKLLTNDIPNWQPGPDGRVHARIRYGPPTGHLQADSPNILNASKHTKSGQLFRRVIVAPEGYWFVEFDYQRFHVVTLGWEAQDESYIKFAKLDCHSIFTSWYYDGVPDIDMSWSESDIMAAVKEYRRIPEFERLRNTQGKHCVLANGNGVGPRKLFWIARPEIPSIAHAERLQAIIAERFPKVEAYKRSIAEKAHRDHRLINVWGYTREFWDVYTSKYDKELGVWKLIVGSQWNDAISFNIQATAFGMMRHKMFELHRLGLDEAHQLVNSIHDSFIFLTRDPEICIADVMPVLASPCRVLISPVTPNGLSVGVDYAIGKNMAKRSPDNPEGME